MHGKQDFAEADCAQDNSALADIRTWLRRTSCALCDRTSFLDGSENEVYLQILPRLCAAPSDSGRVTLYGARLVRNQQTR